MEADAATEREEAAHVQDDLDRLELLDAVGSLRDDVRTMEGHLREVLEEKARLHEEVERLRETRERKHWISEAERVRQEVDQLAQLYDAASAGEGSRRVPHRHRCSHASEPPDRAPWLKKMMMFMMLSELI